jgi:hypothetical protein
MDDKTLELGKKLRSIVMADVTARRDEAIDKQSRFVHYTSAENAMKIIRGREVWLRDVRCMNDYSEIHLGYSRLRQYFAKDENRQAFISAVNACDNGAFAEVEKLFNNWWQHLPLSTYIFCVSEHLDAEDTHGRLSMWRAYGRGTCGVALVLRLPLGISTTEPWILFSPVQYPKPGVFDDYMTRQVSNINANRAFLKSEVDPDFGTS